ncbi:MAG TPA: DUF4388 domain-containing protein [Vicinamibacteria bacterium]|nr:DUF4388 domain-containing protein [Vicinamibacteria bacterium]
MAFQGSLAELHLPDIIQLISVSGKTGVFHLTNGALAGEIYLNDGKIVHAQLDEASGEEAVYALAMWSQGDFRFDPGVASELRTITKSNTNLLMEAARRLDEWRVLAKKIPSTDMVPEFVVQEHRDGQINLNTSEWLILSKIDGHRSVKAIAAATRLSAFDAAKVLYGLVATGLIRLRPAGSAATPAAATKAAAPAKSASPAKPAPAVRPASAAVIAAAAPPVPAASPTPVTPAASPESAAHMARLNRVREVCKGLLGPAGESVVNKHYQKARADIERGAGVEAVEEAIHQIARASSILKGPSTTEALLEQLKAIK